MTNPFNPNTTKQEYRFRADVMTRSINMKKDYHEIYREQSRRGVCHAIGYGDIKTRPDYCKKLQESVEERDACWCCSECCGCGG